MLVDIVNLKLSTQRGLTYNVFPELRAVCVDSEENLIKVYFYINGEISEDQDECCESVLDDVIADFCNLKEEIEFETPFIRLDYPAKMPLVGHWVYYRHEKKEVI